MCRYSELRFSYVIASGELLLTPPTAVVGPAHCRSAVTLRNPLAGDGEECTGVADTGRAHPTA